MPDLKSPIGPFQNVVLPRVRPLGGSKWAASYGASTTMRVAEPAVSVFKDVVIDSNGRVSSGDTAAQAADVDTVFALEAGEAVSLGQFVTGALNIALRWPEPHRLAGPVLTPRQTDVLAELGRLRNYAPVTAAKSYEKVISAGFSGAMIAPAVRLVSDRLRLAAVAPGSAIAVLPVRQFERFGLVNRASLTAWLRAKRFAVVDPERLKLAELIALFAAAPVVLLADPRQAGLLGLCHPGTRILDIAPEGWMSAMGHYFSTVFGLVWQPFLAEPPSYRLRGSLPFGSMVPCSYEIPIRELALALQTFVAP